MCRKKRNLIPQGLIRDTIKIMENKKAKDIVLLKLKKISTITDYFIICSGESSLHMRSIAQELEEKLNKRGVTLLNPKDFMNNRWILLDFGSIVVHIFSQAGREFYQLERLWADAGKTVIGDQHNY
jgi:ribosome-associated protein